MLTLQLGLAGGCQPSSSLSHNLVRVVFSCLLQARCQAVVWQAIHCGRRLVKAHSWAIRHTHTPVRCWALNAVWAKPSGREVPGGWTGLGVASRHLLFWAIQPSNLLFRLPSTQRLTMVRRSQLTHQNTSYRLPQLPSHYGSHCNTWWQNM